MNIIKLTTAEKRVLQGTIDKKPYKRWRMDLIRGEAGKLLTTNGDGLPILDHVEAVEGFYELSGDRLLPFETDQKAEYLWPVNTWQGVIIPDEKEPDSLAGNGERLLNFIRLTYQRQTMINWDRLLPWIKAAFAGPWGLVAHVPEDVRVRQLKLAGEGLTLAIPKMKIGTEPEDVK